LSETGRSIHDLAQPNLTSAYDPIRISAAFNPLAKSTASP
jgi:hypothetical protein